MWEYRATDYTDDDIQHWKYIRKYRTSSGKWRYVYADRGVHDAIKKAQSTAEDSDRFRRATNTYISDLKAHGEKAGVGGLSTKYAAKTKGYRYAADKIINKNSVKAQINRTTAAKKTKSMAKSTVKTVKETANKVYSKGKSAVEKLLAKAKSSQSSSTEVLNEALGRERPTSRKKNITSTEIQPVKKRKK